MKRYVLLLALLLTALQLPAQEKKLSALFDYATFYLAEKNTPYVETYLNFDARTLHLQQKEDGKYRATVEIAIAVRKDDTIAYLKKYELLSPAAESPEADGFSFFDLQRFALSNGIYDMEITLHDKASQAEPAVIQEKLLVYYDPQRPDLSSILNIGSATRTTKTTIFSRNGYDMVPYIDYFIPEEQQKLSPYFEIYNLQQEVKGDGYLIYLSIEQKETGRRITAFDRTFRYKEAQTSTAFYTDMDIAALPSGNYNLVAEVRNIHNEVLLRKALPFQRSNPSAEELNASDEVVATSFAALITDEEKLNYYLDALYPISSDPEIQTARSLIKRHDIAGKQAYLYHFWARRDAMDPAGKWHEYLGWLTYVDETYSYPRTPGYHTDRGRVYLQYGPPDFIRDEKNFVGALRVGNTRQVQQRNDVDPLGGSPINNQGHVYYLPYQLWRYNRLEADEPNRVFLFWDQMRSGYYKLLNSNARGEVREANWEHRLSQGQLDDDVIGEVGEQFDRGY